MTKTPYSQGFYAGVRYQRESILDFIQVHQEQNVAITVDDIAEEIKHAYKKDMEATLIEMRESWGQKS
jgi:hypothetical protein